MYLRFIGPWATDMRRIDSGLFQTYYYVRDEALLPGYLFEALREEYNWFCRKLPTPDDKYFLVNGEYRGLCWFRDDAKTMIRHARTMVNILRDGDIWVTEARTRFPGLVLYRDDYQIVARPDKSTPTQWGQHQKSFRP